MRINCLLFSDSFTHTPALMLAIHLVSGIFQVDKIIVDMKINKCEYSDFLYFSFARSDDNDGDNDSIDAVSKPPSNDNCRCRCCCCMIRSKQSDRATRRKVSSPIAPYDDEFFTYLIYGFIKNSTPTSIKLQKMNEMNMFDIDIDIAVMTLDHEK